MSIISIYSLGTVAENKLPDTDVVEIYPNETLPLMDGELDVSISPVESSGIDREGRGYTASANVANTLSCKWLKSTFRDTCPDVRRGERVLIINIGNSMDFWFIPLGLDDHLRRLETVRFSISAFPENEDEDPSVDNRYFIELSSHKKTITVSTSMRNGEVASYVMQLNMDIGHATLVDNTEQIIQMDTANKHIWAQNSEKVLAELNKRDLKLQTPDGSEIHMRGADILAHNGNGVKFEMVGSNTTSTSPGNHVVNATNHIVNAKTFHNKPVIGGKATYGKINAGKVSAGQIGVGILVAGKFNYPKP